MNDTPPILMDGLDEELVQGFFTDVEESFYPQVSQAMDCIRAGDVLLGVDGLMRPLHTIKGSAAFIGFAEISHFTHKVEDFLKAVQTGDRPVRAVEDADRILRAVDKVFNLLDQARAGEPLDAAGQAAVLEELTATAVRPAAAHAGGAAEVLRVELLAAAREYVCEPVTVLRVLAARVHLPAQHQPILHALEALDDGARAALDLSLARTLNSTTWGALQAAAQRLDLAVFGMGSSCRATFHAWGFDAFIRAHDDEAAFLGSLQAAATVQAGG